MFQAIAQNVSLGNMDQIWELHLRKHAYCAPAEHLTLDLGPTISHYAHRVQAEPSARQWDLTPQINAYNVRWEHTIQFQEVPLQMHVYFAKQEPITP
jgi:hypothetical protein